MFYYRSGTRSALERLSKFFPVPVDAIVESFEAGISPERHCAETILGLRSLGVDNIYLCNLGAQRATTYYDRIMNEVDRLEAER